MRRIVLILLAVVVVLGAIHWWHQRPAHPGPGVLAPDAPVQVDLDQDQGTSLVRGDVVLTTRAHFSMTARVLSREDYAFDDLASIVPVDLAMGWGRMSDTSVLSRIEISQSGRFYYWHVEQFPIPQGEIVASSANMHMIPADDGVKRALGRIRPGQVVHVEGFLVDIKRRDGYGWHTSLSRTDSGAGACEIIYVESIVVQ
ncbi:hypothetical protein [Pinirhizobacter sp.]|jgi:hypothetical protein|uniref:hypothetical protein n=1 Tax=Pinirhizobacter sp. TaxID=2950432 RepID=UPI002F3E59D3